LAAIKDVANKTINPTILQNKASMWALLNQQDPTFKDLPVDQQEQRVEAEIQKRKDDYAATAKGQNPATVQEKSDEDIVKFYRSQGWDVLEAQNAIPFLRKLQTGKLDNVLGNPRNPYIDSPNDYKFVNGKYVINSQNPTKDYQDAGYVNGKDYYLKSKSGQAGLYTFTGDGFIKSSNNSLIKKQ